MDICDYFDRLESEGGKLVRIVTAVSRKDSSKVLDVYKQYENGKCVCRNLYLSVYGGYRVGFPGDKNSLYKNGSCDFSETLEEYGECSRTKSFPSRKITDEEKELFEIEYPAFKYILRKFTESIDDILSILSIWKEHREIEYVLMAGYKKVALNKSFWRLGERKRKEVCGFMRRNPQCKDLSLFDIQTILRNRITFVQFEEYKEFCRRHGRTAYDVYNYLSRIGKADIGGRLLYKDYKSLLLQTSHDKNDAYWKYPKDLQKKHDELREEVRRIDEIRQLETAKKKQELYLEAVRKALRFRKVIDGYSVYVPDSVNEIAEQASKLHQCLVQCDYIQQVIDGHCLLVFIRKNGEPVATAEILSGDRIGQFYADELDRNNCLPTEEVRKVFNRWLLWKKRESRRARKNAA